MLERDFIHMRALDAVTDGIFTLDREGRYLSANRAHLAFMRAQFGADVALGMPITAYLGGCELEQQLPADLERVWLSESFVKSWQPHGAGDATLYEIAWEPLLEREGRVAGAIGVMRNQTAAAVVSARADASEHRFRALLDRSPVVYLSLDMETRILDVNTRWLEELGYRRDEVIGHRLTEFAPQEEHQRIQQQFEHFREFGSLRDDEVTLLRRHGGRIVAALGGILEYGPTGQPFRTHCVLTDVTEREAAEQAARESEARYRMLVDNQGEGVAWLDMDQRFVFVNPAGEAMFGVERGSLVGRSLTEFMAHDAGSNSEEVLAKLLHGERSTRDVVIVLAAGLRRTLSITATPQLSVDGDYLGSFVVFRDVTDQKRIEVELQRTRRMDLVGKLAGGVAHDFNNIVSVIISYADFVLKVVPPDSQIHRDVAEMKKSAQRGAALTRQLLTFSRRQVVEPREIVVNDAVTNLQRMLQRLIGEHIDVVFALAPEADVVLMDPTQFEQVVLNLVVNARDAMPSGGRVTVSTGRTVLDAKALAGVEGANPGEFVEISVQDTGAGISDEVMQRLFEPFFTTKPAGKGTGLGLSVVYGAVKQGGGHIQVESTAGAGATFRVFLPRVRREQQVVVPAAPEEIGGGSGETLLLVEDEEHLRNAMRRLLTADGYRILEAHNGQHALSVFGEHRNEIALILSDVVMPVMSGADFVAAIRAERHAVPVLFLSGHADDLIDYVALRRLAAEFLPKPVDRSVLLAKLKEMLRLNQNTLPRTR